MNSPLPLLMLVACKVSTPALTDILDTDIPSPATDTDLPTVPTEDTDVPVLPTDTDEPVDTDGCQVETTVLYDFDADPGLFDATDPTFGLSARQMEALVWGESTGTLTPTVGNPVGVSMLFGVDGNVEVTDYQSDACGMEWRAPMFVVMSTGEQTAPYTVDDFWDLDGVATSTSDATAMGAKPAADFDGSLPASGSVGFTAVLSGGTWTGEISDSTGVIATYTTTPLPAP